jgi:hypothetical protein
MSQYRVIQNITTGKIALARAKWCASAWCHFKGLQGRFSLPDDEGLLFVYPAESIIATSIHMFFVFFSIGVIWLDAQGKVVDKKLAQPWRPYYAPRSPAQYFIEARPSILERVNIGDVLKFDERVH